MAISLTDKEMDEIRKEALRLETESQKKILREQALTEERARLRAMDEPDEEMRSITVDLAEFTDRITIDGVIYVHGQTYMVPKRKYDVIKEVMYRTQLHEHEISGRTRAQFKARAPIQLRTGHEGMPVGALSRAAGA
jgi:acyl-CoA thioesterase